MQEELFDAFLLGKLNKKETFDFEKKLNSNPEFNSAFLQFRESIDAISYAAHDSIKADLKELHKANFSSKKPVYLISLLLLTVSIILAVLYFIPFKPDTNNTQELFAMHYKDFSYPSTLRGEESQKIFKRIGKFYVNKNYKEVIRLIDSTQIASNNLHFRLVLGSSQINEGNIKEARGNFTYIHESDNKGYKFTGSWYLALLEMKEGNTSKAKELLSYLSNQDSSYSQKAQELLQNM